MIWWRLQINISFIFNLSALLCFVLALAAHILQSVLICFTCISLWVGSNFLLLIFFKFFPLAFYSVLEFWVHQYRLASHINSLFNDSSSHYCFVPFHFIPCLLAGLTPFTVCHFILFFYDSGTLLIASNGKNQLKQMWAMKVICWLIELRSPR